MNFNLLAARLFVAALLSEDKELALSLAADIKSTSALIIGADPEKEYNDTELAELIDSLLNTIEGSRADLNWNVYIPQVLGLVDSWTKTPAEDDNGKTDSESSNG